MWETFDWRITTSTSGKYKPAILKATFNDGYTATAIDGPKRAAMRSQWSFVVSGTLAELQNGGAVEFLERHAGAIPFFWREPTGRLVLVRCEEWDLNPLGGLQWTVSGTFVFHAVPLEATE